MRAALKSSVARVVSKFVSWSGRRRATPYDDDKTTTTASGARRQQILGVFCCAGQACSECDVFDIYFLPISSFQFVVERDVSIFQLVVERDLRTRVRCNARVRDVRKTRNACSTPGPVRRDLTPGGKMRTAGLSHPVVKETHTCEFASFPVARFP